MEGGREGGSKGEGRVAPWGSISRVFSVQGPRVPDRPFGMVQASRLIGTHVLSTISPPCCQCKCTGFRHTIIRPPDSLLVGSQKWGTL